MHDAAAAQAPNRKLSAQLLARVRANIPAFADVSLALASALLLVLSFPDFDLWWLAWIGLAPLLVAVVRTGKATRAFLLGWIWGVIFFYGTCWWLTYPMIYYSPNPIPAPLAYLLLLLPVIYVGLFPALFCALVARLISRFGFAALFMSPFVWVGIELLRYAITGQVWNAIGYSQAFHPLLIQSARWGGVYGISFLLMITNAAVTIAMTRRSFASAATSVLVIMLTLFVLAEAYNNTPDPQLERFALRYRVVAVQPNVPMQGLEDAQLQDRLLNRHIDLSTNALRHAPRHEGEFLINPLVIWPESPMNFMYSRDSNLRATVAVFATGNHTSVLLNSLEPAPNRGELNSAILVNEQGQKVAQYDKIRLMPFGEYVPMPRWLPGASSVRAIVGEFTPGSSYTLMPLGDLRAGVFICIEAAHPAIARSFTNEGADVLINISNDGYLGPTPVMRQHLANAIFRAVENNRPMIRVTNSGISAYIEPSGKVIDATPSFQEAVRTWTVSKEHSATTFYTRHGDVFAYGCALISLGFISASFVRRRNVSEARP